MKLVRGLWSFVDARPVVAVPLVAFRERVPADAERVLRRLRVLRDGPTMARWPCDEPACTREVHENAAGAACPFVAVCSRSPAVCEPVDLAEKDVKQVELWRTDLARALGKVFELREPARATKTSRALDDEPLVLGTDVHSRDVLLGLSRDATSTARWLALRERAPRPTLLLVPTAERVAGDVLVRHAQGAHVEVVVLEDAVGVEGDALVRVRARPMLRVVSEDRIEAALVPRPVRARRTVGEDEPENDEPENETRLAPKLTLPKAKAWNEITIYKVDELTVRVDVGSKRVRCTHIDLGMASAQNRKPTKQFELLRSLCDNEGRFVWTARQKGRQGIDSTKQLVTEFRRTLKALFQLETDPFHPYGHGGWRPRFVAKSRLPADLFDD